MEKLSLNISEAADMACIGKTNLYAKIATGELKAKKIGRRTIILVEDMKNFLANLEDFICEKEI